MGCFKKKSIVLFTLISTLISIVLNFEVFLMGTSATFFNFIVSCIFIFSWFIFSFFVSKVHRKEYLKFLFIYWGISIFLGVLSYLASEIYIIDSIMSAFVIVYIWFYGPLYGFRYILDSNILTLTLSTMSLGLLSSYLGYLLRGVLQYRYKKI